MKTLAQLRQSVADLKAKGLALVDKAEKADRDLSEDEQAQYDEIAGEIETLTAEIEKKEELAERRRTMEARTPAGQNTVNDPNPATTGGFKDLGEFAIAVHGAVQANRLGGTVDPRLSENAATMQGGGGSGEGYELPPEFRDGIWELMSNFDEFGPLIDEEPTSRREVKLTVDETTPWGTAGIKAYWRAEGAQMSESELSDEGRTVPLHELYTLAVATEELLEDAPRLRNRLTNKAAQAIAWKKNLAIVEGTGVGQPKGWFGSAAEVTVAKESGQAADTIVAKNVINMYSRLLMAPGDNPFWLANSDTLPQLMTMTVGDRPIWMPPNGLAAAPGGFLLGLPVRMSEYAKTVGDKGDLQLISPKGYYGARRSSGPKFASSIHLYFDYNKEAFRWVFRYGGQPHLSAPVSPKNGAATKSHFVQLAERA